MLYRQLSRLLSIALVFCAFTAFASESNKITVFYVAPKGDDSNPGTFERPFRTLYRAREEVRSVKWRQRTGEVQDIAVMLRGGQYYLPETARFDENDSSNYGYKITYRNYPGEQPVLVGGIPVTGWKHYKAGVYRARVPGLQEGIIHISQVSENGTPGVVARTPNEGWFSLEKPERDSFCYKPGDFDPSKWDISQLQVQLIETGTYFSHYLPVKSIDLKSRRINLLHMPFYMPKQGKSYTVQNALDLLDSPGEFYTDAKSGYLYYKPRSKDIAKARVEAMILDKTVEFQSYTRRNPVHDITVEGLTFEGSIAPEFTRRGWCEAGDNGHSKDETDRQTPPSSERWGQIYLQNAERITIRDCRLLGSGSNAISICGAAANIAVSGCEIAGSGSHGVSIMGDMAVYRKEDLSGPLVVSKNHHIHNNYIHHVGRLTISGSGVNVCNSSDNVISNNLITDVPRMGITLFSQWDIPRDLCPMTGNVIKNNELARCGSSSWDGGAFYIGATSDNTTFENNRITDTWSWFNATFPQPDDRPDDDASIDFDPGMTYNTYIRNNLCYGENASTVEFGRFEDETILSNNYFESLEHPGKIFVNGQWIDNSAFDISKVSMDIGLTSEYKLPYPKEIVNPVKLPLHCDFKGTISPLFLYRYSGESGHSLCNGGVFVLDSDVQLLRYRHPSPLSKKVTVRMYDASSKQNALCGVRLNSADGKQAVTLGVDCAVSRSHYVVRIGGKPVITSVVRKTGWHELVLVVSESKGCVMTLDGTTAGKTQVLKSFSTIDLGDPGFGSNSRDFGFKSISIE